MHIPLTLLLQTHKLSFSRRRFHHPTRTYRPRKRFHASALRQSKENSRQQNAQTTHQKTTHQTIDTIRRPRIRQRRKLPLPHRRNQLHTTHLTKKHAQALAQVQGRLSTRNARNLRLWRIPKTQQNRRRIWRNKKTIRQRRHNEKSANTMQRNQHKNPTLQPRKENQNENPFTHPPTKDFQTKPIKLITYI